MVQILRTGGPQNISVTGPKKGVLGSILGPAAEGFSRGLGQGLSESFQDYFDEQKEKKYNSVIDEALSKYSEEGEGEATPEQLLQVSFDRKLNLRDKDRKDLQNQAQTMAVVQKNQQLERKQQEMKSKTITPEQEEAVAAAFKNLDPTTSTEADAYNMARRFGLSVQQAKPLVEAIWKPKHKQFQDEHTDTLKRYDSAIKDMSGVLKDMRNSEERRKIKDQIGALQREKSSYQLNHKDIYRKKNQQQSNTGSPPAVSQGPTGPSTNESQMLESIFS